MGSKVICKRCNRGLIVNGKCPNCGFKMDEKSVTNALPNGHHLNNGRYRIVRTLGEGGYGITYEALDLQKKKSVAVKEFFPTYVLQRSPNKIDTVCAVSNSEAALAHARMRFNEEASLLLSLKNVKEIVNVYHSFEDNNTAYYTMELLQGMDMQKRLKAYGRMSWQELSTIVIQIIRALYATHQVGFIHRDITPDNIFLLNDGTAQLIDFGNARRYRANQQLTAVVKDKFAPREQYIRTGKQGPWTDIYSLCVTIYYAMTGVLPKRATERVSEADVLPPLHTVTSVPIEVSRAIQIGMAAEESKRYQSITDFAYAMYPNQTILKDMTRQFSAQKIGRKNDEKKESIGSFYQNQSVTMPVQRKLGNQRVSAGNTQSVKIGRTPTLVCTQGTMRGFRLNLPVEIVQTLGRGQGKSVQYLDGSVGVSRNQCSVLLRANGVVYIKDDGSSYGTSVNGHLLAPGVWKPLKSGDRIVFGREMFVLY